MTNDDTIASRIIARRAELGISQNRLAMQSKVAPAQISRYEAGVNKPSIPTIGKLAEAMDVPFEWLAYGDESRFSLAESMKEESPLRFFEVDDETLEVLNKLSKEMGISEGDVAKIALKAFLSSTKKA